MTETLTGKSRSAGVRYEELLDADSHPVPESLRLDSPLEPGATLVPVERYTSKAFHDLEVEKLWKRVWQMACHEDDIPEVGDYLVYEIAHLSFLVVRSAPDSFKAFYNACLHRGRMLRERGGKRAKEIRCPFHGWTWNLDGSIKQIPCQWDFPYLDPAEQNLPEAKVGRWGGFVFINPDQNAAPLDEHLGDLSRHFEILPYEKRYKQAHVAKILRCNWKVAQEAFMEAYHVVATHPQILAGIGDANSKYDVFGNYSRAISPGGTPSPHIEDQPVAQWIEESGPGKLRHLLSGWLYTLREDGLVQVTMREGTKGVFKPDGTWVEGELGEVDPHLCGWLAGRQLPQADFAWERREQARHRSQEAKSSRERAGDAGRAALRPILGDLVDQISDAELNDSIYFTVFPNFHPWGSFNRIVYRFRPHGDNPDKAIMECIYLAPCPLDPPRPPAAAIHWLGPDDDWTEAPELGMLARVFNQDTFNLPRVQRGLHLTKKKTTQLASYGETKIRHFHQLLEQWLSRE